MAIGLVKDSSARADNSQKGFAGMADGHGRRKSAPRPSEDIPKVGTHVLALCATRGQLDYFVALALQQHGQQSGLRKVSGLILSYVLFLFFSSEDDLIYLIGEYALGVFSERLTVSCPANPRLGRESTNF
jgi:hypothetical protein